MIEKTYVMQYLPTDPERPNEIRGFVELEDDTRIGIGWGHDADEVTMSRVGEIVLNTISRRQTGPTRIVLMIGVQSFVREVNRELPPGWGLLSPETT